MEETLVGVVVHLLFFCVCVCVFCACLVQVFTLQERISL